MSPEDRGFLKNQTLITMLVIAALFLFADISWTELRPSYSIVKTQVIDQIDAKEAGISVVGDRVESISISDEATLLIKLKGQTSPLPYNTLGNHLPGSISPCFAACSEARLRHYEHLTLNFNLATIRGQKRILSVGFLHRVMSERGDHVLRGAYLRGELGFQDRLEFGAAALIVIIGCIGLLFLRRKHDKNGPRRGHDRRWPDG